jgi:PHD/YefM family antitoxin component YafN of YafNO toxin-antitoxin module
MPAIKSVSALRNYSSVLEDVKPGAPVFLTRNGQGRYVIADAAEYDLLYNAAFQQFFAQLDECRDEAEREGWLDEGALRARFGIPPDA